MPRGRRPFALAIAEPTDAPDVEQTVVPVLTPERQRLADALANLRATEGAVAEANEALSKAQDDRLSSFLKKEEAERALERAKPKPSSGFTPMPRPPGAFWGSQKQYDAHVVAESAPPISIADARTAVAEATDTYDSAVRADQFYNDRLQRLQHDLTSRRNRISDAVRDVVRASPELLALANEAKRLATRARAAAYAFEQATNNDVIQPGSQFYGCTKPSDFKADWDGWALSRAWTSALEQLETDPAAALPMPERVP